MSIDDEMLERLEAIERKLGALLALYTHRVLAEDDSFARPRTRSIDKLLHDAGLRGVEIAAILGKTPQAVSYMLRQDKG